MTTSFNLLYMIIPWNRGITSIQYVFSGRLLVHGKTGKDESCYRTI